MPMRDQFPRLLDHKTVLLTGAGGGIGSETALALAAMGARVILAEIDPESGKRAEHMVNEHYPDAAAFYAVDLSDEMQIRAMASWVLAQYGAPDAILNNATVTPMGAVDGVDIALWDKSYAVNLKAPVLLAQLFLSQMKQRNSGVLAFVSSSGASPYMGAYEVFKTAQVELGNTLAMELEGTGVSAFTIGPGLVKTQTAMRSIEIVAEQMGMTTDAFYAMNSQHIIEADLAGLGFALSLAAPGRYHGQEIGCIQVLMDYHVFSDENASPVGTGNYSAEQIALLSSIQATFNEQYLGWQKMNVFERQWVFRDFKKSMGMSAEQAGETLRQVREAVELHNGLEIKDRSFFQRLHDYWAHQLQLLRGYEKNPERLAENEEIITGWMNDIHQFLGEE